MLSESKRLPSIAGIVPTLPAPPRAVRACARRQDTLEWGRVPQELTAGDTFAGHRIEALAGRGGMGVVFRATDLALDRCVALKVIAPALADDPVFRVRFERECRIAAALDHPSVVQVFHAGEEDGLLYVTMRFIAGTDLSSLLARE